jgi:hypothetical protein
VIAIVCERRGEQVTGLIQVGLNRSDHSAVRDLVHHFAAFASRRRTSRSVVPVATRLPEVLIATQQASRLPSFLFSMRTPSGVS